MKVQKRDGSSEQFNEQKIKNAINMASNSEIDAASVDGLVQKIKNKLQNKDVISIEDIQCSTEDVLMASKYKDVARNYIQYRYKRDIIREKKSKLFTDIQSFMDQSNKDLTNENANKDSNVVSSHRDLLAGILSKHLATTQILPEHLSKWHRDGYGHIHDLDYMVSPLMNCCLINYPDMMENGFKIGNAQIGTPQSIGVASTVLSQIVLAVASSQYGK